VALHEQPTAWRRSYIVENHRSIRSANQAGFGVSWWFAQGRLYHQWTVKIDCPEFTIFFDELAGGFGESVETQAIFQLVDFLEQRSFEFFVLHPIDAALKNRLLHTLAHGFAGFGHTAEAFAALGRLGRYVIADKDEHH
jgi:hypothetical protein